MRIIELDREQALNRLCYSQLAKKGRHYQYWNKLYQDYDLSDLMIMYIYSVGIDRVNNEDRVKLVLRSGPNSHKKYFDFRAYDKLKLTHDNEDIVFLMETTYGKLIEYDIVKTELVRLLKEVFKVDEILDFMTDKTNSVISIFTRLKKEV